MIHNPMVSGGSSGGAWKEVTREEVAELVQLNLESFNVLVAIFTPYFPNQPMIVPVSYVFGIGNSGLGDSGICSYGARAYDGGVFKVFYAYTVSSSFGFSEEAQSDPFFVMNLADETGASDIIPEGWEIKYFVYEG